MTATDRSSLAAAEHRVTAAPGHHVGDRRAGALVDLARHRGERDLRGPVQPQPRSAAGRPGSVRPADGPYRSRSAADRQPIRDGRHPGLSGAAERPDLRRPTTDRSAGEEHNGDLERPHPGGRRPVDLDRRHLAGHRVPPDVAPNADDHRPDWRWWSAPRWSRRRSALRCGPWTRWPRWPRRSPRAIAGAGCPPPGPTPRSARPPRRWTRCSTSWRGPRPGPGRPRSAPGPSWPTRRMS